MAAFHATGAAPQQLLQQPLRCDAMGAHGAARYEFHRLRFRADPERTSARSDPQVQRGGLSQLGGNHAIARSQRSAGHGVVRKTPQRYLHILHHLSQLTVEFWPPVSTGKSKPISGKKTKTGS